MWWFKRKCFKIDHTHSHTNHYWTAWFCVRMVLSLYGFFLQNMSIYLFGFSLINNSTGQNLDSISFFLVRFENRKIHWFFRRDKKRSFPIYFSMCEQIDFECNPKMLSKSKYFLPKTELSKVSQGIFKFHTLQPNCQNDSIFRKPWHSKWMHFQWFWFDPCIKFNICIDSYFIAIVAKSSIELCRKWIEAMQEL